MKDFGVQFRITDHQRFVTLAFLWAQIKHDKNGGAFRDPNEWPAIVPDDVMPTFDWVIDSIENGEYALLDCIEVSSGIGELRIDPFSYPYGGVEPFIALAKAFGFEVLGANSYGEFLQLDKWE